MGPRVPATGCQDESHLKIKLMFSGGSVDKCNMTATKTETETECGTLLALATKLEGDEELMMAALENGYQLTGNFKGHEAELIGAR